MRITGNAVAYMSLIADAIKLTVSEKELHNLDYPFKTIPAMKIAKLAVSSFFQEKYKGIGTLMIEMAAHISLHSLLYCHNVSLSIPISFYRLNGVGRNLRTTQLLEDLQASGLEEIKNFPITYDEGCPQLTKEQLAGLKPKHPLFCMKPCYEGKYKVYRFLPGYQWGFYRNTGSFERIWT